MVRLMGSGRGALCAWAVAAAAALLAGCDGEVTPGDPGSGGSGNSGASGPTASGGSGTGAGGPWGETVTSKIDLLLVVDNSRSMADKQAFLGATVGEATRRLVNPLCIDGGGVPATTQPASPVDACPAGTTREFQPILDIHIGVISSSLGGHGSQSCPDTMSEESCGGGEHTTNNDRGHLISRNDPCTGAAVPTYDNRGFLNWDPAAQSSPPGEGDVNNLSAALADMVNGAGQIGCGYEAPLEAMYRFLADPAPYASISIDPDGMIVKEGVDTELLAQRAAFLRPDSALAVVLLSDENDCSIREYSTFWLAARTDGQYHLPPARAVCATDPGDACCASCGQPTPEGCAEDPTCDGNSHDNSSDSPSLRCFDQKRRFGLDFLYPVERYVNAFTQATIAPESPDLLPTNGEALVPNPIFSDLGGSGAPVRGPSLVFMAGIVGVPWQLLANNPSDPAQGYKPATALDWAAIIGDPASYVAPSDPHMIESIDARPGLPTAGNIDPIHGHEYTISNRDDLQYACIFDLPEPRDCTVAQNCDCAKPDNDNPLCTGPTANTQVRGKAYPGIRHLSVIHGLGAQGAVASICAYDTIDTTSPAFGYRPAMTALVDTMRPGLTK